MVWLVNTKPPSPPALSTGKSPGTHFIGGLVGPRAGLDGCGEQTICKSQIKKPTYALYFHKYSQMPLHMFQLYQAISGSKVYICLTYIIFVQ
jgi:hypothetical protein